MIWPWFLVLIWLVWLVAVAVSSQPVKPITRSDCRESCDKSSVKIPFPFGIGAKCYHNPWYEVICNSSLGVEKPFLKKYNLEILHIKSCLGTYPCSFNNLTLELASHWQEDCSSEVVSSCSKQVLRMKDLHRSPFMFPNLFDFITVKSCPRKTSNVTAGDYVERSFCIPGRSRTVWSWLPPPPADKDADCYIRCEHDADFVKQCPKFCVCPSPYEGNPYVTNGCQDPCKSGKMYCLSKTATNWAAPLGLSIGLGSMMLLFCCYGLYRLIRRRRQIKRRANFFKTNGGLLLQQQITTSEGVVERTKLFTARELEKATDSFNTNRVLGQGGQGTVYKGMLPDGRTVAVKKSKKVDKSQLEQFINEVVILSQINHRNVVKVLGCCLETEVPLLVYEFIPNGALSQHIHNPSDDFHITWSMRLLIAEESAGAIAYLHSSSATPIYHRDIKSSNILLDDKYRAKVSDFGTSRTITIDQTHLTTCVQGTFGYLDPEYFQSHQFTDKSDVYSFGVVLVELLTGKKPVSSNESGETKSLTLEFLSHRIFQFSRVS